ncbi:hypothetical protein XENTR_v10003978 [Xenopus tropicalis]|nr:hypothetical protein XENTR_v10003978 [Xenopus tropicalis]
MYLFGITIYLIIGLRLDHTLPHFNMVLGEGWFFLLGLQHLTYVNVSQKLGSTRPRRFRPKGTSTLSEVGAQGPREQGKVRTG